MDKDNLWFCGDTHGSLEHIVEYVLVAHAAGQAPAAIILLGDIDAPRPLHLELDAIRSLAEIYWIPGNHDSDDNSAWNNLYASEVADRNLRCKGAHLGSWRVAGLGGVFSALTSRRKNSGRTASPSSANRSIGFVNCDLL